MRQAEDVVWAAITESARRRFDYDDFKKQLSTSGDERMADFILFQVIEGLVEDLSHKELLLKISGDLERFGYPVSVENLNTMLADKRTVLRAEIHATRKAVAGFSEGMTAAVLLVPVTQILS